MEGPHGLFVFAKITIHIMRDIEPVIKYNFITEGDFIMFIEILKSIIAGYMFVYVLSVVIDMEKHEKKIEKRLNDGWIDCRTCDF